MIPGIFPEVKSITVFQPRQTKTTANYQTYGVLYNRVFRTVTVTPVVVSPSFEPTGPIGPLRRTQRLRPGPTA
jgi:hypothetical protein